MKNKLVMIIISIFLIVSSMCGCRNRMPYSEIREITVNYVDENEDELLILFDMYEQLEQSEEKDYSEIIAFKEEYLMDYSYIRIQYYDGKKKMEIWFDENRDGFDWGIVYCADPSFDPSSVPHTEVYDEIRNGFYTFLFYHGF